MINKFRIVAAASLIAIGAMSSAFAQDFPSKPIRWIVPFAAGGGSDAMARLVAKEMEKDLKQSIVVDNRPGGNTLIAVSALMSAPADGYTILQVSNDTLTINPHLYDVPYDMEKDFSYVSGVANFTILLTARKDFAASNAKDVFEAISQSKGDISYVSFGPSSFAALATEMMALRLKGQLRPVTYKGLAPATVDVVAGRVDLMMTDVGTAMPHIKSGDLKAIAWTGKGGNSILPDVPTLDAAGLTGYDFDSWAGLVAPKDTPPEIVSRLTESVHKALASEEVISALAARGARPMLLDGPAFRNMAMEASKVVKDFVDTTGLTVKQ